MGPPATNIRRGATIPATFQSFDYTVSANWHACFPCTNVSLSKTRPLQEDVLIGVLSVRECLHYGALVRLPRRMARAQKRALVDEVIAAMGLTDCASTPIGNWHLRGISGGQRRRVSIAMELITRPSLLLLVSVWGLASKFSLQRSRFPASNGDAML